MNEVKEKSYEKLMAYNEKAIDNKRLKFHWFLLISPLILFLVGLQEDGSNIYEGKILGMMLIFMVGFIIFSSVSVSEEVLNNVVDQLYKKNLKIEISLTPWGYWLNSAYPIFYAYTAVFMYFDKYIYISLVLLMFISVRYGLMFKSQKTIIEYFAKKY